MRIHVFLASAVAALAVSPAAPAAASQQISVNGTGAASVPAGASDSQQQTAYDQALSAAVGDAQTKARAVAGELSLTLGAVQSFTEQSDDYLGYCGIGFLPAAAPGAVTGTAAAPSASRAVSGQLTRIPSRPAHKRHKARKKAHRATTESCQVEADVTIVYTAG